MAGQGSPHHPWNDQDSEVFLVKKPASNSSREIRDAILREHFGYTETDITELDKKKPGYFYISDSTATDKPASVDRIRGWSTNGSGEVPISMSRDLTDNLIKFREERAVFEVFRIGMFITDAAISRDIKADLENILSANFRF